MDVCSPTESLVIMLLGDPPNPLDMAHLDACWRQEWWLELIKNLLNEMSFLIIEDSPFSKYSNKS